MPTGFGANEYLSRIYGAGLALPARSFLKSTIHHLRSKLPAGGENENPASTVRIEVQPYQHRRIRRNDSASLNVIDDLCLAVTSGRATNARRELWRRIEHWPRGPLQIIGQ